MDARALIAYSPDWIARGKIVFSANCAACHGELGRGDGPAAATMNPRPRNFTSPDGWKNGYDLPAIYLTLGVGIKGSSMAAFDYLSKSDRMALAHYVQALGAFPHGEPGPAALAGLTKDLSAPGGKTPNRIPVSMAMARLEAEYHAPVSIDMAGQAQEMIAGLLRRVILDPSRAAQTLAGNVAWREDPKQLAASILPGTPGNGFAVDSATLSPLEWQTVHGELLKLVPEPTTRKLPGGRRP